MPNLFWKSIATLAADLFALAAFGTLAVAAEALGVKPETKADIDPDEPIPYVPPVDEEVSAAAWHRTICEITEDMADERIRSIPVAADFLDWEKEWIER